MKKTFILFSIFLYFIFSNLQAKSDLPIQHFYKVNEGIFRGARLSQPSSVHYLKKFNIKNVINLQGGDLNSRYRKIIPWVEPGETLEKIAEEKNNVTSNDMGFFHAPLSSLKPVSKEEDQQIDEILNFMEDQNNWPLFIHCEHGADRTGLIIALYRVKYEGMNPITARSEWIKKGHNKLHQFFTKSLDDYFFKKVYDDFF